MVRFSPGLVSKPGLAPLGHEKSREFCSCKGFCPSCEMLSREKRGAKTQLAFVGYLSILPAPVQPGL